MKAMSLRPRASLVLTKNGKAYGIDLRARPGQSFVDVAEREILHGGVRLELHRDDCTAGPVVNMSLDDARLFQRALQSAIDEAYRIEKEAFKAAARELQPEVSP